ncbi:hypothetical protein [Gloeobacter kilaueensis]|nr:hypothetical protein [Gloeobacter kilaueensis]
MVALRPRPLSAARSVISIETGPPEWLLDTFLRSWPIVRQPGRHLHRLIGSLNRRGWRCAVIDGGRLTLQWRLLNRSGRNARIGVASIDEGLQVLDTLQQSGQFDLVILHDLPCSLNRLNRWLAWTPGSGAVLWLRSTEAVLLVEQESEHAPWLERLGRLLEKMICIFDRWNS